MNSLQKSSYDDPQKSLISSRMIVASFCCLHIFRYGYKREEVVQTIQDSVGDGSVLRVKYKDSISYRNPAKVGRSGLRAPNSSQPRNAPLNASKRVMRIVRQITMQPPASSEGASPALIWSALIQQKQFGISDQFLAKILKHLTQLGNYRPYTIMQMIQRLHPLY